MFSGSPTVTIAASPGPSALLGLLVRAPVPHLRCTVPARGRQDGESGLRDYDVQYGTWTSWLSDITQAQADFLGERDQSYYFRVQATDHVNNPSAWVEAGPVTVSAVTKYYYHGGQRIAMRRGDVVYFIHADHLGSTSLTTDLTGTVVAETRYLPYGEQRWITGTLVTDFTFTGQRAEAGFRLMDYNARYYDPGLGRFVSADPVVPEPGNPQAWNRYSYGLNNPLRYVDPTGHQDEPTWWEKLKRAISQLLDIARRRNPDTGYDTCGVFGCQTLQGPPQQVLLIGPQEAEQLRQLAQITDQAERLAKFTSRVVAQQEQMMIN